MTKRIDYENGDYLELPEGFDLAGSGGCFAGNTPVLTPSGWTKIRDIKPGDIVLTYPEYETDGQLVPNKVINTWRHDPITTKYPLIKIAHEGGFIVVTTNHWILNRYGDYVEAGTITAGEYLVLDNSKLSRVIAVYPAESQWTYNLEVDNNPTFIAARIRVHNGGGGKGGSSRQPVESPDDLRSIATARILIAYSHGETTGLTNSAKSIFFDKTPLMNASGDLNFDGVTWNQRFGLSAQPGISGFVKAITTTNINTQITKTGGPVVRSVTSSDIDDVRVVIRLPALLTVNSSNGDQTGGEVSLTFEVKDPAGTWENRGTEVIKGKTRGDYQIQRLVRGPDTQTGVWDVRVTRNTDDSTSTYIQNDTFWDQMVEIQDGNQQYPRTALVGITVDTELFGDRIPRVALEMDGIKVRVPTNRTEARTIATYSATWNGTFKWETTDNPAWIAYHLIRDEEIGMGLGEDDVDKFSFYDVGRYCDEQIPNGDGGTRKRYTINTQITGSEDAFSLIQTILSTVRGLGYFGAGDLIIAQDSPKEPGFTFNNENVENGIFRYSSAQLKDIITVANVEFTNKDNFYETEIATYPRQSKWSTDPGILRYGRNEWSGVKFGCNNYQEAEMFAKWIVDSSQNESEMVNFTAGLDASLMRPGDIFEVYDSKYAGSRQGGRIVSAASNWIRLDAPVVMSAAQNYYLVYASSDGFSLETAKIRTSAGSSIIVSAASAFPTTPTKGWLYNVKGDDINPRPFRCISMAQQDGFKWDITGVFYDSTKFGRVEFGVSATPAEFTRLDFAPPSAPSNFNFNVVETATEYGGTRLDLDVSWTRVDGTKITYIPYWRYEDGGYQKQEAVATPLFTIRDIKPGNYDVLVYARNIQGQQSVAGGGSFLFTPTSGNGTAFPPENLQIAGGGTTFNDRNMRIEWDRAADSLLTLGSVERYKIEIRSSANQTSAIRTDFSNQSSYIYTYDNNLGDNEIPRRSLHVRVFEEDRRARFSTDASAVFTNPTISLSASNVEVSAINGNIAVSASYSDPGDYLKTFIWISKVDGFTPSKNNLYTIEGTTGAIAVNELNTVYYYRYAGVDSIGVDDLEGKYLDVSNQNLIVVPLIFGGPPPPINVSASAVTFNGDNGSESKITFTWTSAVSLINNDGWEIQYRDTSLAVETPFETTIARTTSAEVYGLKPNTSYEYRLASLNGSFRGEYTSAETIITSGDNTIPNPVSSVNITPGIGSVFFDWVNPGDSDLARVQIVGNTVNNRNTAPLVTQATGLIPGEKGFTSITGVSSGTVYYWLRAVDTSDNPSIWVPDSEVSGFAVVIETVDFELTDNSVFTSAIQNNAITTAKITNDAINNSKLAPGSVSEETLQALAVTEAKIADAAVVTAKIDDGAVTTTKIANAAITTAKIQNAAITTALIGNAQITGAKIGVAAVSAATIANAAITTTKIGNAQITGAKIGIAAVSAATIADAAIITAKINNLAVTTAKIQNLGVTNAKIGNLAVNNAKIADAAITTAKIADAQITNAKIANLAVTGAKIANATITTANIGNAQIRGAVIANAAVSAATIANASILNAKIANAAITTAKIADAQVNTLKIAGQSVSVIEFATFNPVAGYSATFTYNTSMAFAGNLMVIGMFYMSGTYGGSTINTYLDINGVNRSNSKAIGVGPPPGPITHSGFISVPAGTRVCRLRWDGNFITNPSVDAAMIIIKTYR